MANKYQKKVAKIAMSGLMVTRRIEAKYVGGKIKSVDYDEENDKDIVVTEELTLGIEIKVFYKS